MKQLFTLFLVAMLCISCMGGGGANAPNTESDNCDNTENAATGGIKEMLVAKMQSGLESLAARMEQQQRKQDSLNLVKVQEEVSQKEVEIIPPPQWSVMRMIPEIPSAEDLVAGNTAEYLAALERFKDAAYDVYYKFTDSVSHNRAQLARFGHTQAELDAMNEQQKNETVMKAYKKMNEEQALKEQIVKEEAAKLDASSLGGMLKSMAQLKQREEEALENAEKKFFEENADVLPLIDEYHKLRSEHRQWIDVTEDEKHYEFFNYKGIARMELWRNWYIEVQQRFHALAPLAREADRNMLKVKMPSKKSRSTSMYDFMNEFNLNRYYYEFMKSITEKDPGNN